MGSLVGAAVGKVGELGHGLVARVGALHAPVKAAAGALNHLTGGHLEAKLRSLPYGSAALDAAGKVSHLLGRAGDIAQAVKGTGHDIQSKFS